MNLANSVHSQECRDESNGPCSEILRRNIRNPGAIIIIDDIAKRGKTGDEGIWDEPKPQITCLLAGQLGSSPLEHDLR